MIKTINCIMIFAAAVIFYSCNNAVHQKINDTNLKTYEELEKIACIIGKWENNSSEGKMSEIWEKKNDSTFSGKSFFIIGKDTVSSETISLEQRADSIFYIPTVKNQNNGQAVKFVLTSSTISHFVFENPEHDFPQKITYTQITEDSLMAEISGIFNGKQNAQKFPMRRTK